MKLRRVDNPPNPYESAHREWLVPPPEAKIEVYEETASSILSRNDSPDLPFTWSINPYRGCQHACAYCYARPYHEYLGYGAGTDFDTKLVVKVNAAELLRRSLTNRRWRGEAIMFSGVTDCYQPLEASYGVTRACLEVCLELENPVAIVTKGFLVVRDAELLAEIGQRASSKVWVSIPFADAHTASLIEPQVPPPERRFEMIRRLTTAGVDVGVFVSPIIPGLTDRDVPRILKQAAESGARSASMTALRLPGSVEHVFLKRLEEVMPMRFGRIVNRLRDIRGGKLNESRFGARMQGQGAYWKIVCELFAIHARRLGLNRNSGGGLSPARRQRVRPGAQVVFDFARGEESAS